MLFPENSSSPVRPRHVELRDIDVTTNNNRPPTPHPVKSHQKITVTPSPRNDLNTSIRNIRITTISRKYSRIQ